MSSPSPSSSPSRDRRRKKKKEKKEHKEKKEQREQKEKKEQKEKVKRGEVEGQRGRSRSRRRAAGQRGGEADEDEAPGTFGASGLLDEDDEQAAPPALPRPQAGHRDAGSGGAAGSGRGLAGRSRSRDERRPPGLADGSDAGGFGKGKGKGGKGKGGGGPGEEEAAPKEEPSFEASGLLAVEDNAKNGIPLKYTEPAEARLPSIKWRFYCFTKQQEAPKIMHIHRKPGYLFGKDRRVVDIPTDHQTCSKQHAVLHHRFVGGQVKPYIMDLESINGTFLNGDRIDSARYYELRERDVLKFGMSSREFVLLHGGSANHIKIDPNQLKSDEE
mmetsp:Transcript_81504/g.174641  ORF Transcript_81504/g.174641 Transcript_81504/m.174641 type:complete len:329 (-) Transcript_81504:77-1063(-)